MERKKLDELKAAIYWLAVNYQQNYYEVSSDWNKYKLDEHTYLKNYIGYALYGSPEYEESCCDNKEDGIYVYKEKGAMQLIEEIYNKIVKFGTQLSDDKEVLCSILYTCIYDENSLQKCDEERLNELIYIKPIFKVLKNIKVKDKIELQYCYIDTDARVYSNWNNYLKNNNLPKCTMIIPKDGIYQADLKEVWSDKTSPVWVEVHSNNKFRMVTKAVDVASTVINIGCVGIGIAAMVNPIAAPIALAGAAGGIVSGVWGGGRAIGELVDRGTHDQSISVVNKHALPAWLGVVGSSFGLAASSGSALLSRAIRTGTTVGTSAQLAHDTIMIGNLFVNSVGIGFSSYGVVEKYRETGEVSSKDVFFLTAHILFVCNSAVKMRLASDIIKSDQNKILQDYEDSLRSNRHKKAFRHLVRNTGNQITDEVHRNEQIIRSLSKISNKDQFFATMVQNRKIFATTGTELSFADGQVQINGVTLVNPSTFASMSKDSILNLINQTGNNSSSTQGSTIASSSKGTFISATVLKSGISTVKDFYVQKSIPLENHSSEYKDIISDLQNVPERSEVMQLLLDTGLCIVQRIMHSDYTTNDLLSDATHFIWKIVQINLARSIPGFHMFEDKLREFVFWVAQETHDYVKATSEQWINAFWNYMNSVRDSDKKNPAFEEHRNNGVDKKYNGIVLLDPIEIMTLPKDISTLLVQEALGTTGSSMNETSKPPKEMIVMCEDELNEFFSKHPTTLDFKLTELADDLKGILIDIGKFDKKNIIFYKLLIISLNIPQSLIFNESLEKDVIVDLMKCLWIFVIMNFSNILPDTCMFNNEHEDTVMNIIIALYKHQISNTDKWLSAFEEYRLKYSKQ